MPQEAQISVTQMREGLHGHAALLGVLTFGSHSSTQQGGQQVPQQTPQMATQQQMPCQQAQQVQGGPVTAGPYVS